jgi:hypothetical protein
MGPWPPRQDDGVVPGQVDVGQHQRREEVDVDHVQIGAEVLRPLLAADHVRLQADLVDGGFDAAGSGEVHVMSGLLQGAVSHHQLLGPEPGGVLAAILHGQRIGRRDDHQNVSHCPCSLCGFLGFDWLVPTGSTGGDR